MNRTVLLTGAAVVATALVAVAAAVGFTLSTRDEPDRCQGAAIDLTLTTAPGSPSVAASLLVTDREQRRWEVHWMWDARSLEPEPLTPDVEGVISHGTAIVGDVDDGDERTVQLRPAGSRDWCTMTASY